MLRRFSSREKPLEVSLLKIQAMPVLKLSAKELGIMSKAYNLSMGIRLFYPNPLFIIIFHACAFVPLHLAQ